MALKAIPIQKMITNPYIEELIANEFGVLSKLNHRSIVKIIDIIRTDKEVDLIYEYCEEGNLMEAFRRRLFDEQEGLEVLFDLADALLYLKNRSVTHRDIKPENILLTNGRVKLADFGLCKEEKRDGQERIALIGSYAFMAPEVIESFIYSSATDVYALGILMYDFLKDRFEIFSGRLPFKTQNLQQLLVEKKAFRVESRDVPLVSQGMIELLDRMVHSDPQKRIGIQELFEVCSKMRSNAGLLK